MEGRARLELMLTLIVVLLTFGVLYIAQGNMNSFYIRVLNLAAIYAILALSLNLILGFTGMFSLGPFN
jgi:branched-chain amino acid transport system permease protein